MLKNILLLIAKKESTKWLITLLAYSEHINQLDWMSDETKKMSQTKLNKIIRKLGYPDKWKDYSKLEISRESYFKMLLMHQNLHSSLTLINLVNQWIKQSGV